MIFVKNSNRDKEAPSYQQFVFLLKVIELCSEESCFLQEAFELSLSAQCAKIKQIICIM